MVIGVYMMVGLVDSRSKPILEKWAPRMKLRFYFAGRGFGHSPALSGGGRLAEDRAFIF